MKRQILLVALALVVAGAGAAMATPESAAPYDPNCPCFRWPSVDMDQDGVWDQLDDCVTTPKGCVVDKWGCSVDSDGDKVCDGLDECPGTTPGVKVDKKGCSAEQRMAMAMPPPPAPSPAAKSVEPPPPPPPPPAAPPVSQTQQRLMTGNLVLENVYFEFNSAKLTGESEPALNELGTALEKFAGLEIEIQGHTDSKGAAAYNQKLSQARAESVRGYLLEHFQLTADNLKAKGYGESKLLVSPEKSPEDYARNRRVEVHVLNPEALPKGVEVERK